MQLSILRWQRLAIIVVLSSVSVTGCPRKQDSQENRISTTVTSPASQAVMQKEPAEPMNPAAPVAESISPGASQAEGQSLEIPKVVMAEIDRAKCMLFVGDSVPNGELPEISGGARQMTDLFGKNATVLVFWNSGADRYANLNAVNLLSDMQADIYAKFQEKGITVVGIHVGPSSQEAEKIVQESGARFPILVDGSGDYFRQFSSHQPPCLYLVDHSGKILWLDVEYSRSAREALKRAVAVVAQ